VQDSQAEAPPNHLANPVCLPLSLRVAGRAEGCRATKLAPLYRSLTKRCSGPSSKQHGVRMFRSKTAVSSPNLKREVGDSMKQPTKSYTRKFFAEHRESPCLKGRYFLGAAEKGATERPLCESMSLLPC